jgi:hypothetical protein
MSSGAPGGRLPLAQMTDGRTGLQTGHPFQVMKVRTRQHEPILRARTLLEHREVLAGLAGDRRHDAGNPFPGHQLLQDGACRASGRIDRHHVRAQPPDDAGHIDSAAARIPFPALAT